MTGATPQRGFWTSWRGLAIVAALALAFGAWLRSGGPPFLDVSGYSAAAGIVADRAAPSQGSADAPVTLVVFTDYRCPICRADEGALADVAREEKDVRVAYRDWPIFGPPSREAARVAIAAARQGRYVAIHEALMAAPSVDPAGIRAAAAQAGVDWDRLRRDLAAHGPAIDRQLAANDADAAALGLPGTPAYLAGHHLAIGRMGSAGFRRLIAQARQDAGVR